MQKKDEPNPNSSTQKRKAHVERMKAAGVWDSKTTPAEDPLRPGYKPVPGKTWNRETGEYLVDIALVEV